VIYACCSENRKAAVIGNPTLNGIDYLEVVDHEAPSGSPRQQTLLVYCLKAAPVNLTPANVLIQGGESITEIAAVWLAPASPPPSQATAAEKTYFASLTNPAQILVIRTSVAGDFSPYTLRLVNDATQATEDSFQVTEALDGFDPQLAEVSFSFKVECGPDFDCTPATPQCPPNLLPPPPINYLAKDYGSFRTILLDRLRQLLPSWQGTSEADIGVVLAELIAYAGDQLSYQQDAVATEAYINTARSRISLRRHALLVAYRVHDGCNARAWVQLTAGVPVFLDHTVTRFYTFAPAMPSSLAVGAGNEQAALDAGVIVFQPMQDANLFPEQNQMQFYTWGDTNCCLPQGATEATLMGSYPNLQPGDVLIFKEVLGPQTGVAADADMRHRCAVRLTAVTTQNGRGQPLVDPLFERGTGAPIVSASQLPTPVTEIQWSVDDALLFPVCISSKFLDSNGDEQLLTNVSVVLGNVVLADQGLQMAGVPLKTVPEPNLFLPPSPAADRCNPTAKVPFPVRYRPRIADSPITQAVPLPVAGSPVTPASVPLLSTGFVSLTDSNGFVCLMVEPDAPWSWPQYFGIVAQPNATNKANFDLAVVFCPSGGAAGIGANVTLEQFTDLTLAPNTNNNAINQLNSQSRFVAVTPGFNPPANNPTTFPAGPTRLTNSGTTQLQDAGGVTYLVVQPANPLSWPPLFAILAQGNLEDPSQFNLLLLYQPPSGAVGVQIPVVVERFTDVSLATAPTIFASGSDLITVRSFEQAPNPSLSAYDLMNYDANQAVPAITLTGTLGGIDTTWTAAPDLLASGPADTNFVVEIEADGTAYLRFGDDTNGQQPLSNTAFSAAYRIGNGTAGNVGADSLVFFAGDPRIAACTNPIAASGGVDPETNEQIRRRAPQAFLTQERAITMTDYANTTEANTQVEDAVAMLRWTGSWYTVFIAAEPQSGGNLTQPLKKSLTQYVNRFRLAGQDLKIESPNYVPLEIALTVCVDPSYFQSYVKQSLLQVLGNGTLPNGQPAFFAPGRFELGQTVYLSPLYAAARTVAGVRTVTATAFQPQGIQTQAYLDIGEIPLGPFQVARMDNDPSRPNNGQLTLTMEGGK
jgi:hypothetical protein